MPFIPDKQQSSVNPKTSGFVPDATQEVPKARPKGMMAFLGSVGKTVGNLAVGALKGAGSTALGLSELGQRTLGKVVGADTERSLAFSEGLREKYLTPKGTAQQIGFGAEQIGEFFVPMGAAGKATKAIEAASGISKGSKLGKAVGLAAEAIPQMAGDVGVSLAQTGGDVKESLFTGALGGAGIVGGKAISKAIQTFVNPGTKILLTKAIRPTGREAQTFTSSLDDSLPALGKYAEQVMNAPEEQIMQTALLATKAAKAETWAMVDKAIKESGETIDGTKLAEAIRQAGQNKKMLRENPGILDKIEQKAMSYEGEKLSPIEAEDILEETNAVLQSYYRKTGSDKSLALKADPELATELHLADAIRSELDRVIQVADEKGFSGLKKTYGALSQLDKQLSKRIPIVERANMTSLAEQVSAARTAGNVAVNLATGRPFSAIMNVADVMTAKGLKDFEKTENKLRKAFSNINKDYKKAQSLLKSESIPKASASKPSGLSKGTDSAMGAMVGMQPEYDEQGNITGMKYNPELGMAGAIGGFAVSKLPKGKTIKSAVLKNQQFHPEDAKVIIDYADAIRLKGKADAELELAATRVAEAYGVSMPKTEKGLANNLIKAMEERGEYTPTMPTSSTGKKGTLLQKEVSDSTEQALISEAKKYKSAEEFVKAQGTPVYHQSQSKTPFTEFKQKGDAGYKKAYYSQADEGIYFSPSKELVTSKYGKDGGVVIESIVSPKKKLDLGEYDAMYFDGRKVNSGEIVVENFKRSQQGLPELKEPDILLTGISKKAKNWLEKNGYDAVDGMKGEMWSAPELVVLDKNIIKTKSQLTDIWNKAQKSK